MRADLRVMTVLAAAALAATPMAALAQAAPQPTTNTPATDAVGPAELQNFSLKGTVTRQADQPAVATTARPQTAPVKPPVLSSTQPRSQQVRVAERATAPTPSAAVSQPPSIPTTSSAVQDVTSPPPVVAPTVQAPVPDATVDEAPQAASRSLPLWPWIAAVLAVVAGGAFLLWHRRSREALADGPQFDLLVAPQPEPQPQPQPQPQRRPEPSPRAAAPAAQLTSQPSPSAGVVTSRLRAPAPPAGIVSSRLRPALELGFHPLRCQVDDNQVAIEFELELFNSGTAPARAVLAEASLINASATQDRELAAFFAKPNGVGDRLDMIPPMKRVSFRSQVVAPREAVQEYELAGRRTFVPVIAFNALYEWSGGTAQSSAAYLVGRDTQQEKLGPLRLDQGAREFRELGARPLPTAVRT